MSSLLFTHDSYKLSIGFKLLLLKGYRDKFYSILWSPVVFGCVYKEVVSNSFVGFYLTVDYINIPLFDLSKT